MFVTISVWIMWSAIPVLSSLRKQFVYAYRL